MTTGRDNADLPRWLWDRLSAPLWDHLDCLAATTGSSRSRPRRSPTGRRSVDRPYHFGSQGASDVYSNHTSHSNRLIPVYTFGRKVDLGAVTGANSGYRDAGQSPGVLR